MNENLEPNSDSSGGWLNETADGNNSLSYTDELLGDEETREFIRRKLASYACSSLIKVADYLLSARKRNMSDTGFPDFDINGREPDLPRDEKGNFIVAEGLLIDRDEIMHDDPANIVSETILPIIQRTENMVNNLMRSDEVIREAIPMIYNLESIRLKKGTIQKKQFIALRRIQCSAIEKFKKFILGWVELKNPDYIVDDASYEDENMAWNERPIEDDSAERKFKTAEREYYKFIDGLEKAKIANEPDVSSSESEKGAIWEQLREKVDNVERPGYFSQTERVLLGAGDGDPGDIGKSIEAREKLNVPMINLFAGRRWNIYSTYREYFSTLYAAGRGAPDGEPPHSVKDEYELLGKMIHRLEDGINTTGNNCELLRLDEDGLQVAIYSPRPQTGEDLEIKQCLAEISNLHVENRQFVKTSNRKPEDELSMPLCRLEEIKENIKDFSHNNPIGSDLEINGETDYFSNQFMQKAYEAIWWHMDSKSPKEILYELAKITREIYNNPEDIGPKSDFLPYAQKVNIKRTLGEIADWVKDKGGMELLEKYLERANALREAKDNLAKFEEEYGGRIQRLSEFDKFNKRELTGVLENERYDSVRQRLSALVDRAEREFTEVLEKIRKKREELKGKAEPAFKDE